MLNIDIMIIQNRPSLRNDKKRISRPECSIEQRDDREECSDRAGLRGSDVHSWDGLVGRLFLALLGLSTGRPSEYRGRFVCDSWNV